MVDLARKNLLHDKTRFATTVAGVAFAVTLVLFQVGLFLGLLDNATVILDHIDAELWVTSRNGANVDFAHTFPETYVQRVRSVPGVARADNLILEFVDVSLPSGVQEASLVWAMEDFSRWGVPWELAAGHPDLQADDLRRGPYVLVDESASKRFGPVELGDRREFNGRRLEVIGKTRGAVSFTTSPVTFMDIDLLRSLSFERLGGQTTYIVVKLEPGVDVAAVQAEIEQRLPYNDVHTSKAWSEQSRGYWIENTGLGFNMFMTVFLGCLVGVVVVAQTLYAFTMEHLREFGTLKAIGGSNSLIYGVLFRQATISGLIGFVLGVLPVFAIRPVIARGGLELVVPAGFAAVVFVGTLVLCLAAAVLSFRKVATIDPALVFRT